jgi:hypothetical protein
MVWNQNNYKRLINKLGIEEQHLTGKYNKESAPQNSLVVHGAIEKIYKNFKKYIEKYIPLNQYTEQLDSK